MVAEICFLILGIIYAIPGLFKTEQDVSDFEWFIMSYVIVHRVDIFINSFAGTSMMFKHVYIFNAVIWAIAFVFNIIAKAR